jgi:hypothetical protein
MTVEQAQHPAGEAEACQMNAPHDVRRVSMRNGLAALVAAVITALPLSTMGSEVGRVPAYIKLGVTTNGAVTWNAVPVNDVAQLEEYLAVVARSDNPAWILIQPQPNASYASVETLIKRVRNVGLHVYAVGALTLPPGDIDTGPRPPHP